MRKRGRKKVMKRNVAGMQHEIHPRGEKRPALFLRSAPSQEDKNKSNSNFIHCQTFTCCAAWRMNS